MLPKIMRQPFHHCYSTVLERLTSRERQEKETNHKQVRKLRLSLSYIKNIHRIWLESRGKREGTGRLRLKPNKTQMKCVL